MSPEEADFLLDEWARWQRTDPISIGWAPATPFGKQIKPDPSPSSIPIDEERAIITDRVLAKMPRRIVFIVRLHYLGMEPIDTKARRMHLGRKAYLGLIESVRRTVGDRIDQTRKTAYLAHSARGA